MKRKNMAAGLGSVIRALRITLPVNLVVLLHGQADFGVITRHGGLIEGTVEGPIRVLEEEASLTLNEKASVAGNLVLPRERRAGTDRQRSPELRDSISPRFAMKNLAGASAIKGVQRVERNLALPPIEPVVVPEGASDFSLNDAVGERQKLERPTSRVLAAGAYGHLNVTSGTLRLGNSDGTRAKYSLRTMTIGISGTLELISPVCITVLNSANLAGTIGMKGNPYWLELRVFAGDTVIGANAEVHAFVNAPSSHVSMGEETVCAGAIVADRVTIGKNSTFLAVEPQAGAMERDGTGPLFPHKALRAQAHLAEFYEGLPDHLEAVLGYRDEVPLMVITERIQPTHRLAQQQQSLAFLLAAQALLDGTGFELAHIELYRLGTNASPTGEALRVSLSSHQYLESLWAITKISDPKTAIREVRDSSLLLNLFLERCCRVTSATWRAR